jgi:FeoC like transcriptional regulator
MNPLFALRDCLRERRMATAGELAAHLQLATAVVEDMLGHWIRRGSVEAVRSTGVDCGSGGCASCRRCASDAAPALYRWRDQPARPM